jgi:hypothetical protein
MVRWMTMRRLLLPTIIATTALTPAAAMAADSGAVHVKGSPTMHRIDSNTVEVDFKTDKSLPRRYDGKINASVTVHGGTSSVGAAGKTKNSYASFAKLGKAKRGSKFIVTIHVKGQPDISRSVTLR